MNIIIKIIVIIGGIGLLINFYTNWGPGPTIFDKYIHLISAISYLCIAIGVIARYRHDRVKNSE